MVKRQPSDRAPLPDFPLWHGIPRMVPPPFGLPRLPLVAAEPPPQPTLTRAPATSASTSTSTSPLTPASPHSSVSRHPATPYPGTDYRPPPRHSTPSPPSTRPAPFGRLALLATVGVLTAAATYTVLQRTSSPSRAPTPAPTAQPHTKQHPATPRPTQTETPPSSAPSSSTPSSPGLTTFPDAISAIASAPLVHYVGEQAARQWDASSWDIYVTAEGNIIGTETVDAEQFNVLIYGNAVYFETPDHPNTWIGDDSLAEALPSGLDTPSELAAKLGNALPGGQQQTTSLGGTPAIAADTKAGVLFFSADTPQTLLRIDSTNSSGGPVEMNVHPTTPTERRQVEQQLATDVQEVGSEQ